MAAFALRETGANSRATDLLDQFRQATYDNNFDQMKVLSQVWVDFAQGEADWLTTNPPGDPCYADLHATVRSAYGQMAEGMRAAHQGAEELNLQLIESGMTTFDRGWALQQGAEYQLTGMVYACSGGTVVYP